LLDLLTGPLRHRTHVRTAGGGRSTGPRAGSARDYGAVRRAPRRFLGGEGQRRAPCSDCGPFEGTSGVAPTFGLGAPARAVGPEPAPSSGARSATGELAHDPDAGVRCCCTPGVQVNTSPLGS
jgi:hypothetical protein